MNERIKDLLLYNAKGSKQMVQTVIDYFRALNSSLKGSMQIWALIMQI